MFGLLCLVAFGIWDQYPRTMRPDYGRPAPPLAIATAAFVKDIEKALPTGAMVFQLPFTRYPESPAVLAHHAHFAIRFYLHSDTLRWSTGSCRGREGDAWGIKVAEQPLEQQLETLAAAGFRGIQISRNGYEDNGAEIECQLRELLGVTPIESGLGEETFFSMEPYLSTRAAKAASAEEKRGRGADCRRRDGTVGRRSELTNNPSQNKKIVRGHGCSRLWRSRWT